MSTLNDEFIFNNSYCARVKELREARGITAAVMADLLGTPADRYRKYETRSPLPPYLVERFARIVGRDIPYILTGKSPKPVSQRTSIIGIKRA